MFVKNENFSAISRGKNFQVITGSPVYGDDQDQKLSVIDQTFVDEIVGARLREQKSHITEHEYSGYFHSRAGFESVLYLRKIAQFTKHDRKLLELFSSNMTLAFDNLAAGKEFVETHRGVVQAIADLLESRDPEARGHNQRISEYAHLVARLAGMQEVEINTLINAIAFHDIGMITVSDQIVRKVGGLNPAELVALKKHPETGAKLLGRFHTPLMQKAAIIAGQHHERWDGTGYPYQLSGEAIHPCARIAALVDTLDSLSRDKPWRPAFTTDQIRQYISNSRGTHFEPRLCDLVLERFDTFVRVIEAFKD
jgi:response regulator RpfG family c-di-GMP phosphodiesterase